MTHFMPLVCINKDADYEDYDGGFLLDDGGAVDIRATFVLNPYGTRTSAYLVLIERDTADEIITDENHQIDLPVEALEALLAVCQEQKPHMTPDQRQTIERRVVTRTVEALLDAGYALNVNNGGDDHELPDYTTDRAVILDALFATDADRIYAQQHGRVRDWVYCVYGNDGWDVIADYTVTLDAVLAPINRWTDAQSVITEMLLRTDLPAPRRPHLTASDLLDQLRLLIDVHGDDLDVRFSDDEPVTLVVRDGVLYITDGPDAD